MRPEMPDGLRGLPWPWHLAEYTALQHELKQLSGSESQLLVALDVLDRAMRAKALIGSTRGIELAEEVDCGFFMSAVDRRIGELDQFDRGKVEAVFDEWDKRQGTDKEVDDVSTLWLAGAASVLVNAAIDWLLPALREDPESTVALAYRKLVRERWKLVLEEHASSLISCLCVMRCPETEELLGEVENDPDFTEDLRRAVMGVRSHWKEDDYYAANPDIPRY